MKFKLFFLITIIFLSLVGCNTTHNNIDFSGIEILIENQYDVEPGTYLIPYTIEGIENLVETYDIDINIVAIDKNNQTVEIQNGQMSVVAGDVYTVTIELFIDNELVKTKTATIHSLSITLLETPTSLERYHDFYIIFQAVNEAVSYIVLINDQAIEIQNTILDLTPYMIEPIDYEIKVKAIDSNQQSSLYSTSITISNQITSIELFSAPLKLSYLEGEVFDSTEMRVELTYKDGYKRIALDSELTYRKDILTLFDQTLTITHTLTNLFILLEIEVIPYDQAYFPVTFDGNGGTLVSGEVLQSVHYNSDAIPPVFERKGFLFDGYDGSYQNITNNVTLTAKWIDLSTPTEGLIFDTVDYQTYYVSSYFGQSEIIIIPDTYLGLPVVSIEDQAFLNNKDIKTIYIGSNVKSILFTAFNGVDHLSQFIVSEHNPNFRSENGLLYSQDALILAPNALSGEVVIPPNTVSIAARAFYNSIHVTSFDFPLDLTEIGEQAFHNTAWFNQLSDGPVYISFVLYGYKGEMPSQYTLNIEPSTISIADSAFANQSNLINITFGPNLKHIGRYAFYDTNIECVILPSTLEYISYNAFAYAEYLSEVHILSDHFTVDSQAFDHTQWLNNQPEGLIYLNKVAYKFKGNIPESVILREDTYAIADGLFYRYDGNTTLKNVYIPQGLTYIGDNAFNSVFNFEIIYIPSSVNYVGINAFLNTYSNLDIYVDSTEQNLNWNINWNPNQREVIYVNSNPTAFNKVFNFQTNVDGLTVDSVTKPILTYFPSVINEGYELEGWFIDAAFTTQVNLPYHLGKAESVTLYAKWSPITYEVIYVNQIGGVTYSVLEGDLNYSVGYFDEITEHPIIDFLDYTFLGWKKQIIESSQIIYMVPSLAKVIVSTTEMTGSVIVSASTINAVISIDVGQGLKQYTTPIEVDYKTTIQAKASSGDIWVDLPDIVINNITHERPNLPTVSYYPIPDNMDYFIVVIEKPIYGSEVTMIEYKINNGDWTSFTSDSVTFTIRNDYSETIYARSTNIYGNVSYNAIRKYEIREIEYQIFDRTITRYQVREKFNLDESIRLLQKDVYDSLVTFMDYRTDQSYHGCGPAAVYILLRYYGADYNHIELMDYIETTDVSFIDEGIFTTPAQLSSGIENVLKDNILPKIPSDSLFDISNAFSVYRGSPNSSEQTLYEISESLRLGNPVIILSDDGNHYRVITEMFYSVTDDSMFDNPYFVVHDNSGSSYMSWDELDYFFEDNFSAEAARAIGYTSYRDTIIFVDFFQFWIIKTD